MTQKLITMIFFGKPFYLMKSKRLRYKHLINNVPSSQEVLTGLRKNSPNIKGLWVIVIMECYHVILEVKKVKNLFVKFKDAVKPINHLVPLIFITKLNMKARDRNHKTNHLFFLKSIMQIVWKGKTEYENDINYKVLCIFLITTL